MHFYETVIVFRQDITPGHVEGLVRGYTETIKGFSGQVTKTEFCGLRTLAYPIKKNKKGHYVLMNIAVVPAGLQEIERQMRNDEDILRYLSIRVETLDNTPSPLMQQKSYRDTFKPSSEEDFETIADVTAAAAHHAAANISSSTEEAAVTIPSSQA